MFGFLRTFWKSISFLLLLLAILYIAPDVQDGGAAVAAWKRWFSVFSLEQYLIGFCVAALLYIIWMDARPWLYERFHFGPKTKWMIRAEDAEAKLQELTETRLERIARMPDIGEGPRKNAARNAIRLASKEHLWPAIFALTHYYAEARDEIKRKFNEELARKEIVRGADELKNSIASRNDWTTSDLQVTERIQKLTLQEAETHYYNCYCRYMGAVALTYAFVNSLPPVPSGVIDRLKIEHEKWKAVHDAAVAAHMQMKTTHPELRTIPDMHTLAKPHLVDPDWDKLKQASQ